MSDPMISLSALGPPLSSKVHRLCCFQIFRPGCLHKAAGMSLSRWNDPSTIQMTSSCPDNPYKRTPAAYSEPSTGDAHFRVDTFLWEVWT
ncbi:hypothetical protein BgiBS90_017726, partial [Biomphalaria glabrata]